MSPIQTGRGVAALLSAILPGLGQLYNRQWAKAAGFLLGIILLDAALGVSVDTMTFFQSAAAGLPTVDAGSLLLRMLPILGLAIWSVADASRTIKQTSKQTST
jgi:TM2 domain-containing membrane protein YozV